MRKNFLSIIFLLLIFSACKGVTNPDIPIIKNFPKIISFTANPNSLLQGEKSVLSWQVENADFMFLDNISVPLIDTKEVSPLLTTTYNLIAKNQDGNKTANCTITVNERIKSKVNISLDFLGETYPFRYLHNSNPSIFICGGNFAIVFTNTNNVSGKVKRIFISSYGNKNSSTNIFLGDVEIAINNLQFSANGICSVLGSFSVEGFITYFIIHAEIEDINSCIQNIEFTKTIIWDGSYGR
jgi:hypothetical protein